MTYPIIQRELTVHLQNGNWYLRPVEDEKAVPGPVDYGWHAIRRGVKAVMQTTRMLSQTVSPRGSWEN